jgi:hypothetical protein
MGHISKKLILSEVAGNTEQRQQTPKIHKHNICMNYVSFSNFQINFTRLLESGK